MTNLLVRIAHSATQEFRILAAGPGVRFFEGWPETADLDPDMIVPDPVLYLGQCVALGFFPRAGNDPAEPALELIEVSRDPAALRVIWQVRMRSLDLSILRVLTNILLGRRLDVLELRTAAPLQAGTHLLQELPLDYPQAPATPGFEVDYQELDSGDERLVRIALASEPDDPVLDSLYQLLEVWVDLLLLGAFPEEGQDPADSGAIPDFTALIEPTVVEQTFSEAFHCHEQVFALGKWSTTVARVQRVIIR